MEIERKSDLIVKKISHYPYLKEFTNELESVLLDIYRDELKLKLLESVSKKVKIKFDEHKADGSCKHNYPKGGCPTDEKYENAFMYIEQEYDKIVDDINVYGTLNHLNAHVFGENYSLKKKQEISENIDSILGNQTKILEGQLELNEELIESFNELKELLFTLNKKSLTDLLKGQVLSASIGLGVNPENLNLIAKGVSDQLGL
jgi:hypothetical protein